MKRIVLLVSMVFADVALAQWSTPTVMANVNTTNTDFDPVVTFTGFTLYLSSLQPGNYEIFRATRTAPYGQFGAPVQITELSSTASDAGPFPRLDDLEIFFYSDRPGGGGGGLDLWRADRASAAVPFNPPVPVTELNTSALDRSPSLTIDGLRIYFDTGRPGGTGSLDIWTATRPSWGSPFGTPTPVTELNSTGVELNPHVSPDGLAIFFNSDRPGGPGGFDLWMASRVDPSAPFGTPVLVSALNSTAGDQTPSFAQFHDEFFFASDRPGGRGGYDLYTARFTGLLGLGIAGPGSAQSLRFSDPSSSGLTYIAASSRGSSPGIPIDTRVLPLNFDLLLQLTIGGLPPVLTGFVGTLDQDGTGSGRISFAGFPELRGLRFVSAFIVLDPAAPSSIRTISDAHEVLVQ